MKKEINYRVIRIFTTLLFLVISSILWKDSNNNMVTAKKFLENNQNEFVELTSGQNLFSSIPVSDEIGLSNSTYKFKIINTGNNESNISIIIINNLEENYIPYNMIRYQVKKNGEIYTKPAQINENGILFDDTVNNENIYEINFWVSESVSLKQIENKSFSIKIALL